MPIIQSSIHKRIAVNIDGKRREVDLPHDFPQDVADRLLSISFRPGEYEIAPEEQPPASTDGQPAPSGEETDSTPGSQPAPSGEETGGQKPSGEETDTPQPDAPATGRKKKAEEKKD